jgi:hypothetical protein
MLIARQSAWPLLLINVRQCRFRVITNLFPSFFATARFFFFSADNKLPSTDFLRRAAAMTYTPDP